MEVREAQAFLAVAEELNFGRAAERLHMAQPPLSRLIRHIESDLGALLFVRNTRHVSLTPQGEAVVDSARELVMLSQRIKEIVRRSQEGELGRVRIGFGEATVNSIVGQLAHHTKDKRPGIGLDLLGSHFSLAGMEKLLKGHLDLLVGRQDFLPDEVDSRVVAQERLLIALPDSHRLAQRDVLTLPDVAEEAWVVLPGGGASLPNRLNLLAVNGGFVPRVAQVAPDSATLLLLVGAGMGIAPTLSSVRECVPAPGVVYKSLMPDQGPVEVRLIWRRDDPNTALRTVLRLSEELFPTPAG